MPGGQLATPTTSALDILGNGYIFVRCIFIAIMSDMKYGYVFEQMYSITCMTIVDGLLNRERSGFLSRGG